MTGGESWSFNFSGHKLNTMYRTVLDPVTGTMYGASSSVHDMYMSTHLTDASIDKGDGLVLSSINGGQAWETVWDAQMPVIWISLDPTRPDRMCLLRTILVD